MKILMVSAEVLPFAKVGGAADVVSSLAIVLKKIGHDVKIITPKYKHISEDVLSKFASAQCMTQYSDSTVTFYTAPMPNQDDLPVYFVGHQCFDRDGIYGSIDEPNFADNPKRFALLSHAVFELCRTLNWIPDILHSHDWFTALVPILLKYNERQKEFSKTASIFTIHNLGMQGIYEKHFFSSFGLDWSHFYSAGFEDWDRMNILKAALISSDMITTVSPSYAEEIKRPEFGFRMDEIFRTRHEDLFGVLNGVDTAIWNPATDSSLEKNYTVDTLSEKKKNKVALQEKMGLEKVDVPLIGMITRLVDQKGVAELFGPSYGSAHKICSDLNIQMVVLGMGEKWCEKELEFLSSKLPNFKVHIGFDEKLGHQIEAGCDFFLMPSRYEPCGLNQLYSLLYGTLPIVRSTGGLIDTVEQYNQDTGEGTGFIFYDLTPNAIFDTVGWAVYTWYNKPEHIQAMQKCGMKKNFTWDTSAKKYIAIYEKALKKI